MNAMKKLWRYLFAPLPHLVAPTPDAPAVPVTPRKRISETAKANLAARKPELKRFEVKAPELMPGVVPAQREAGFMALDSAPMQDLYGYVNGCYFGMGFPGYPFLADLTQRSEYRSPSETIAQEMVRKWIKVTGDDSDKVDAIEAELKRMNVRDVFYRAALHDGFFGRAQIYVDLKGADDATKKLPLIYAPATVKKGSLLGFKNVEPMWTTPFAYNSNDPLARDFYKPTAWYVLGKQVHASRLLTMISREVPDLLKPAYNFGGQSLSQLMQPYVDAWLSTRDSVNNLVRAFSITGIKTDLSSTLNAGSGQDLMDRIDFFTQMRDNLGLMTVSNDVGAPEDFFQLNTPLGGLDHLQAQAQEHMSAPSHIPLVKLFGISPSGLNATSEGELTVFYDFIHAHQESFFGAPLKNVIDLIMLDQFGAIDPDITFEFVPLEEMNGTELAAVRKSDADAAATLITAGVLSPEEERERLASDPNSGYDALVPEDLPEPPDDTAPPPNDPPQAADAAFVENDHPRAENGKFGSGGGGSGSTVKMHRGVGKESSGGENIMWVTPDKSLAQGYADKRENGRVETHDVDLGNSFDAGHDAKELTPRKFAIQAAMQAQKMKLVDDKTSVALQKSFAESFDADSRKVSDYWADESGKKKVSDLLTGLGFNSIKLSEGDVETHGILGKSKQAADAAFVENDHPRAENGKFGSGGGGGTGGSARPKPAKTLADNHPLLSESINDTSARAQAERATIFEDHFKDAKPVTGRKPVIYFMGGGGGSGKGTLKKQLQLEGKLPSAADGAVSIDPDEIKTSMQQFKDIKEHGDYRAAGVVHEDSSALSKKVLEHAKQGNYDIVFDATLSDGPKAHARFKEFKEAGYDVKLFSVTADPDHATDRAFSRWEHSGRYVDPAELKKAHNNFNDAVVSYENSPHMDTANHYENYDELRHVRTTVKGKKQ
jgi:phage-related protein (TIGR01555 family)